MDIFEWEKCGYLLMVDYYSRFIEVTRLGGLSTEAVIGAVKGICKAWSAGRSCI